MLYMFLRKQCSPDFIINWSSSLVTYPFNDIFGTDFFAFLPFRIISNLIVPPGLDLAGNSCGTRWCLLSFMRICDAERSCLPFAYFWSWITRLVAVIHFVQKTTNKGGNAVSHSFFYSKVFIQSSFTFSHVKSLFCTTCTLVAKFFFQL